MEFPRLINTTVPPLVSVSIRAMMCVWRLGGKIVRIVVVYSDKDARAHSSYS